MTRTDDDVRREHLAHGGWQPDEIDRWIAEHPKPTMLSEQAAILAERGEDLLFFICQTLGILALAKRLGMKPRPWAARKMQ